MSLWAGGGVNSHFYKASLKDTYEARVLKNLGIPPLTLTHVPAPQELNLQSIKPRDYHRFLVAFGLSVPFGEGPEFRLPSQFEKIDLPKAVSKCLPDYADQKAIFD